MANSGRRLLRLPVRLGMTAVHRLLGLFGRVASRPLDGVRAVVMTPTGEIVLVRQSYTRGWHLPAGGRRARETAEAAIRRELREEIGLRSGAVAPFEEKVGTFEGRPYRLTTFVVRDARYRARWNLEIEEVGTFAPAALPSNVAEPSRGALRRFLAEEGVAVPLSAAPPRSPPPRADRRKR